MREPGHCLNLVRYVTQNTGALARKYISDPELLRFIDMECYAWSTVSADLTPFINTGMVFCYRHYGRTDGRTDGHAESHGAVGAAAEE